MKLATYQDGSRDGQLLVVSRDLATAHYATGIANTLQQALDDWNFIAPQLQDLYTALNHGKARHGFAFDPRQCMAPLPRAFQLACGSAYLDHLQLLRGAELPASLRTDPLIHQGASDDLLGPCDPVVVPSEAMGIDFGAGLAVVTGDVPLGADADQALAGVRLLLLANGVSLRQLAPAELARGGGPLQSQPATAFGPVAITPEELGEAWQGGRVHLALQSSWNGRRLGLCEAGPDMAFHFGQLIAHLCRTRRVRAGTIVTGGTVSNPGLEQDGRMAWPKGHGCIAEKRAVETLRDGAPTTEYLKHGDTLRIEMKGKDGQSVFGAIEQDIAPPEAA